MVDMPFTPSNVFATLGMMSPEEMSDVLQVSVLTLATWRCKKRGPPSIKLGKKIFYLFDDFAEWTRSEANKQRPNARASSPSPRPHLLPDQPGPAS